MEDESRAERRARHRGAPSSSQESDAKPRGRRALPSAESVSPKEASASEPEQAEFVKDQFSVLIHGKQSDGLDDMRAATCASLAFVAAILLALIHPPTSGYLELTPLGVIIPLLLLGLGGWFVKRGRHI